MIHSAAKRGCLFAACTSIPDSTAGDNAPATYGEIFIQEARLIEFSATTKRVGGANTKRRYVYFRQGLDEILPTPHPTFFVFPHCHSLLAAERSSTTHQGVCAVFRRTVGCGILYSAAGTIRLFFFVLS